MLARCCSTSRSGGRDNREVLLSAAAVLPRMLVRPRTAASWKKALEHLFARVEVRIAYRIGWLAVIGLSGMTGYGQYRGDRPDRRSPRPRIRPHRSRRCR